MYVHIHIHIHIHIHTYMGVCVCPRACIVCTPQEVARHSHSRHSCPAIVGLCSPRMEKLLTGDELRQFAPLFTDGA